MRKILVLSLALLLFALAVFGATYTKSQFDSLSEKQIENKVKADFNKLEKQDGFAVYNYTISTLSFDSNKNKFSDANIQTQIRVPLLTFKDCMQEKDQNAVTCKQRIVAIRDKLFNDVLNSQKQTLLAFKPKANDDANVLVFLDCASNCVYKNELVAEAVADAPIDETPPVEDQPVGWSPDAASAVAGAAVGAGALAGGRAVVNRKLYTKSELLKLSKEQQISLLKSLGATEIPSTEGARVAMLLGLGASKP